MYIWARCFATGQQVDCFLDLIKVWHGIQCLVVWNSWETVNGLIVMVEGWLSTLSKCSAHLSMILSLSVMREDPSALRGDDLDVCLAQTRTLFQLRSKKRAAGHWLRNSINSLSLTLVLQDYKDASIIHLFKHKGNRQACDNQRGISLLLGAGNLARVLPWQDGKRVRCKYLLFSMQTLYGTKGGTFLRLCMGQQEVLTVHTFSILSCNWFIDHLEQGLLPLGYQHGAYCQAASREVSRTEQWPVLHLCQSDQGLWHC